jgi:nonsense-mediated mRNA decay protein 3
LCSVCEKSSIDITEGITKNILMHYCKGCDRYLRPPWTRCDIESQEMMSLCLSKIKGLGKVKIVDTSFVWTEPHSKIIKLKLTIMKEIEKSNIQTSFIVEYKIEWTQCDDCKKTFTPHLWSASVQIRQKVSHKRTFLLLEQIVLKHNAHSKALNVSEQPEGVDFFFQNKSNANSLIDFIGSMFPIKTKESKQLISHDMNSNLFNYKYSIMVEIAPVCPDDLIVLNKQTSKELGGCGPVLLTYKVSSRIHLICPLTFKTYEFDENTYWRHNFRSYIDRTCLQEFLIINVDEEIDYKKLYKKGNDTLMTIDSVPTSKQGGNSSKSTNYKNLPKDNKSFFGLQKRDLKVVTVQCILNDKTQDGNVNLLSIKTHLGEKIRPGDIYYGYDLTSLIMNHELEDICADGKIPDFVLVKKKFKRKNNKKRIWKLKHLDKEKDPTNFRKNNEDEKDRQYEEFLRDIEENKELRKNINIYKVNKFNFYFILF